ncbi:hypothetical protein [Mollivirus kamchatka]|nr:hypothetical protein [Mollivirus kamchatka]
MSLFTSFPSISPTGPSSSLSSPSSSFATGAGPRGSASASRLSDLYPYAPDGSLALSSNGVGARSSVGPPPSLQIGGPKVAVKSHKHKHDDQQKHHHHHHHHKDGHHHHHHYHKHGDKDSTNETLAALVMDHPDVLADILALNKSFRKDGVTALLPETMWAYAVMLDIPAIPFSDYMSQVVPVEDASDIQRIRDGYVALLAEIVLDKARADKADQVADADLTQEYADAYYQPSDRTTTTTTEIDIEYDEEDDEDGDEEQSFEEALAMALLGP